MVSYMSFENLSALRQFNPAWRLLSADNAGFICSFLNQEFIQKNVRELSESRLMVKLDDYITDTSFFEDREISSKDLLTTWTEKGWLRRFFINKTDEIHYDLTSWSQKAIEWLASLEQDDFIATESRLIMFFQLIDSIADHTNVDPKKRIADLNRRKKEIDAEIEAVKNGNLSVLEPVQIKDRFTQAMQTGRDILSDFREVEENFRSLDRQMREKITAWTGAKGTLLAEFFEDNDKIGNSEQGKSFYAFYEFLSSQNAQDSYHNKIEDILKLQAVTEIPNSEKIKYIASDWADGSEHVMRTMQGISSQLNRYISDNFLQEERRINQTINRIEKQAVFFRNEHPKSLDIAIDTVVPAIHLPMHRPLYTAPVKPNLSADELQNGASFGNEQLLYAQIHVDKRALKQQINACISNHGASSLGQIIAQFPIQHGLAEIVTYFAIAGDDGKVEIDQQQTEKLFWQTADGKVRSADMPKITFKSAVELEG